MGAKESEKKRSVRTTKLGKKRPNLVDGWLDPRRRQEDREVSNFEVTDTNAPAIEKL